MHFSVAIKKPGAEGRGVNATPLERGEVKIKVLPPKPVFAIVNLRQQIHA